MEFVGHHVAKVHAHYVRALGDRVNEIVSSVSDRVVLPPHDDSTFDFTDEFREEPQGLDGFSFEALALTFEDD